MIHDQSLRAFFAIEINDQVTLDNIESYQNELQKSVGPLKLVNRDLMHITLRFLGNISEKIAQKLYFFMEEEINAKYFKSESPIIGRFKGIGDFDKRVFFVKIDGVMEILTHLNQIIESKLKEFKEIQKEDKPFKPHLTLARSKKYHSTKDKLTKQQNFGQLSYTELKKIYSEKTFGDWNLVKVELKQSQLTPNGPIYTNIHYSK